MAADAPATTPAEEEVVRLCHDLLRIDSTNTGDPATTVGERAAAEHVAALLDEVGLEVTVHERTPGRTNLVTRIAGTDPTAPALLVHGHLDVVPAAADDWSVHPFSGELRDGCLWGRGAVDMKDMDAMVLAVVRDMLRSGRRPRRDLVVAFLADEEAGGEEGALWLVQQHPELFEGVTEAVSEVGGYSVELGGRRAYLLQTAEKGMAWLRLAASGTAGHGSQINDDNAVTRLCQAVARIGAHPWPLEITPTVRAFLEGVEELTGIRLDPDDPDRLVEVLGSTARFVGSTFRTTVNPTVLRAGYKHNVIPGDAEALVDCRFVPGSEATLMATLRELAGPGVEVEALHHHSAVETGFEGDVVDRMVAALRAEDPDAAVLPYCLSAGTDNKHLARLGIRGFGFTPLRLPPGLDFAGMFHGVDERIPVESLRFGTRVLARFLATA